MDIEVASILWNRGARPLPLIDRPQYEIGKERRGERNLCLPVVKKDHSRPVPRPGVDDWGNYDRKECSFFNKKDD
jgi:hypothetical protein